MIFVLAPLLLDATVELPVFIGEVPGKVVPSTVTTGTNAARKVVAGYIKVLETGPDPLSTAPQHLFSPSFKSDGWIYYALPYALDRNDREATVKLKGKSYRVRLPVDHEMGPAKKESKTVTSGPWTIGVDYSTRKHSMEGFRPHLTVRNRTAGAARIEILRPGYDSVQILQEHPEAIALPFGGEITLKLTELKAVPLRLRVARSPSLVEFSRLDGRKVLSTTDRRVDPLSGFTEIKFRKTRYGKPVLADVPNWKTVQGGIVDAVGIQSAGKEPTKMVLRLEAGRAPWTMSYLSFEKTTRANK